MYNLIYAGDNIRNNRNQGQRHRIPRYDFYRLNESQFRARYRLTKEDFVLVLRLIIHRLWRPYGRNRRIPPIVQLLVALRFYATGSYLLTCADCLLIGKTVTWKIVHRVSPLIAALSRRFIRFPETPEEILQTQGELFMRSGFPGVVGCIDGRHVRIQSYGGELAELYRNRHQFFSINVQAICNARLEFTNFVARWPGSTHDATIFEFSRIQESFRDGQYGGAVLVGDSGYSDQPFMMTPLRQPQRPEEQLYNEAQIRTRNCIERCFGVWARRFAVVSIGSRFRTVERTIAVIQATAVLHNICMRTRPFRRREVDIDAYNAIHRNIQPGPGNTVRQQLINGYFHQLINGPDIVP